jgi:hypothetical protein
VVSRRFNQERERRRCCGEVDQEVWRRRLACDWSFPLGLGTIKSQRGCSLCIDGAHRNWYTCGPKSARRRKLEARNLPDIIRRDITL